MPRISTPNIESLERSVRDATDDEARIDALLVLASTLLKSDSLGARDRAAEAYELAVRLARPSSGKRGPGEGTPRDATKPRLARASMMLGQCDLRRAEFASAARHARKGLALFEELNDQRGIGEALNLLGNISQRRGRAKESIGFYKRSLEIRERLGDADNVAGSLINLSYASSTLGDFSAALDYGMRGVAVAEETPVKVFLTNGLQALANIYTQLGDYPRALEQYLRVLELDGADNPVLRLNIGTLHVRLGNYDDALDHLRAGLRIARRRGDPFLETQILSNIGSVHHHRQEYDRALASYTEVLEKSMPDGVPIRTTALLNIGRIHFDAGEYHTALERYNEALEFLNEEAFPNETGYAYYCAGQALVRLGEYDRAEERLVLGMRIFEKHATKVQLFEVYRALAECREGQGRLNEALDYLRKAFAIEKEVFNEENSARIRSLRISSEVDRMRKEAEIYRLRTEKLDAEREHQQRRLTLLTLQLTAKNEGFGSIRGKAAAALAARTAREMRPMLEEIVREADEHLRDETYWTSFLESFDTIYPDFSRKLLKKAPRLTPTEVRVCTLIAINLSTKQIAAILYVTEKTVEAHRTSIRKKLGLTADASLQNDLAQL